MAEAVLVGLAVGQFVSSVLIPVAIVALPETWKKIVKIWKGMKIKKLSDKDQANLSIIHTTMTKLERISDQSWLRIPNASSLLTMLQFLANSLETMIGKRIRRIRIPIERISERIKSIAVTLQILDNYDGLEFYQKRKENLLRDLLDILSKDDLLFPEENSNNKSMVTTFPGIRYVFGPTKTLSISSSVLECIEHVLRWLRDFKLDRGSIEVALYDVFTEILPQALMEHLGRSRFGPIEIGQFRENVRFFRSFPQSSTFVEIQGEVGLKLDHEEKINVNLRYAGWTTWNELQQRIDSNNKSSTHEVAETSSRRKSFTTDSASVCDYCKILINGDNQVDIDLMRERHSLECRRMQQQKIDNNLTDTSKCLVCPALIGHLSSYEQQVHVNACLDRGEERRHG